MSFTLVLKRKQIQKKAPNSNFFEQTVISHNSSLTIFGISDQSPPTSSHLPHLGRVARRREGLDGG